MGAKEAQERPENAQEGPRVAPGCSKRAPSFFENCVPVEAKRSFSQSWFHEGPDWDQDGPKMAPRGFQEGSASPTWAQEGPKWGAKEDQERPKRAQERPTWAPGLPKRAQDWIKGPKFPEEGPRLD